jgi:hypothetical protein
VLNYEIKQFREIRNESTDDSRNSAQHKITDLNIAKLVEDIEYENLKKTAFVQDYKD